MLETANYLLGDQSSFACPNFYLPLFECKKLLLLIKKNKSLRGVERFNLFKSFGHRIVDLKFLVLCLDHDFLIKLFQEFDFAHNLVEFKLLDFSSCVDVDESHRNCAVGELVQQEHDAIADFELCD